MKALLPAALICILLLTGCSSDNTSTASDDFPQISANSVENQSVTEFENIPTTEAESEVTLNTEPAPGETSTAAEITDPVVTERTSAVSFDDILKYYRIEGLSHEALEPLIGDAATGEYDREFDLIGLTDKQEQQVFDYLKNHELTLVGSDTIFDGNEEPDYAFTLKLEPREPVSSSATGLYRYMNFSSDGKYMKLYGFPNPEIYLLEDTEELQFLYDIDAE
jgi:hypothetical protein